MASASDVVTDLDRTMLLSPPTFRINSALVAAILTGALAGIESLAQTPETKLASTSSHGKASPTPKKLTGSEATQVENLEQTIDQLCRANRFAKAIEPARQAIAICEKAVGAGHWKTGDVRRKLETLRTIQGLSLEGQKALAAFPALQQAVFENYRNARYAEAERLGREVVQVLLRWLGEGHPETAAGYDILGEVLGEQGKLVDAEIVHRRALAARLKILGENHPDTASSYSNLAVILDDQGKLPEAETMNRHALAIALNVLGEVHPETATIFSNLGVNLLEQDKPVEAETMHRRALAIRLQVLATGHQEIAVSYNNLAEALRAQGKLAKAEAMTRRALEIKLKALDAFHPSTAISYSNLAETLRAQGKLAEAEATQRRALAIRLKTLGEGHPETAKSYNNLALVLDQQGKLAEGEKVHRHELAITLRSLGEHHPATATSYSNLATIVGMQGKLAEAEPMHRRALALRLKALGNGNRETVESYLHLGQTLDRLGKTEEALKTLTSAVQAFGLARLHGPVGLESALLGEQDPSPALALALAGAGHSQEAWERFEQGLARSVLDEVAGRAARPLTPVEHSRESDLLKRNQTVDEQINRLAGRTLLKLEDEKHLDHLRREESDTRRQLIDFQLEMERKYGPIAGRPLTLQEAQSALPADTALLGWVDTQYRHAACIVRSAAKPSWITVRGSSQDGAWTIEDEKLARRLREVLSARCTMGEWKPLAQALARQRLGPLERYLKEVRRLVVLNSPGLAGVPVEILLAESNTAGKAGPVVSYAPSSSMFVYLTAKAKLLGRPTTLLAVGDPAYPLPQPEAARFPPSNDGLYVAALVPNGNADLCGVRAGDILLEYNGKPLKVKDDLHEVEPNGGPSKVVIRLWRAGESRRIEVAGGSLGVEVDTRPVADIILAQRAAAKLLASRADPQVRLPGTRREVEAIAQVFPPGAVTTILGDDARESVVQALARSSRLKDFRYLHFAAHGRDDSRSAYHTALILAPEADRSDNPLALEADGEITAEEIARTWALDADLVVFSACESALGIQAGGEGLLGFAPPLLAKGARALVLSLWKVDDHATALLMTRFYQNLLGRRKDLPKPMPKAEALDEAKRWLRELRADQVEWELAALDRGAVRRRARVAKGKPESPRPFEHPYFWAAFILIGNPD
jgi:CHAT domain-containing protein/Tfp pilus assembly protein PilF